MSVKRKSFVLVDGYNLYHGIDKLCHDSPNSDYLKWVSLEKIINQFMRPETHEITEIIYFTAYAFWKPEALIRHRLYIRALEYENVQIVFGQFKKKRKRCLKCGKWYLDREEKETDVNIAIRIIQLAYEKSYDDLLLITGDTDIVPAIKNAKQIYNEGRIRVIAPPERDNYELIQCADKFSQIKRIHLEEALLPEVITPLKGKDIKRPKKYDPPTPTKKNIFCRIMDFIKNIFKS